MSHLVSVAEKQAIAKHARQLGFSLFGVTDAQEPEHFDLFSDWIAEANHGEMEYLATERSLQRRRDPRIILPECRAILVLGTPYWAHDAFSASDENNPLAVRGRVAAYAWGLDYHDVLKKRMEALVAHIHELVGEPFLHRIYTDTGPLLERELAQRAGLGWIGKNSCLINPRFGSYIFLSEILLDLKFKRDEPYTFDRCGTCTRCLDACPTQCILPNRTLDARRCISYLTIELKGNIPEELRSQIGDRVFGCDICQEVCPWNKSHAKRAGDPAFAPRTDIPRLDLIAEMGLTKEIFSAKYSGRPLKRVKRAGHLRNVAVCSGNSHEFAVIPALGRGLLDPEPIVRLHAAWALGEIGGEQARSLLIEAEDHEHDPAVQEAIRLALARLSG